MKKEIDILEYLLKKVAKNCVVTREENKINIDFNILCRQMDTYIQIDEGGFNITSKKVTKRVNFKSNNLAYKFKIITNFMTLIDLISLDAVENSVKPIKGD